MSSITSSKGKGLLILYGSQTGCSKEVAELLGRMGKRRLFECETLALDDYPLARLPTEHLVIFVVATTGDGDPPDNMMRFWRFIRQRNLPSTALCNVLFSVFGMGDSSYANFNVVARKLQVRLRQLGATEFYNLGLGDDQSAMGVEGDVDTWSKSMWQSLLSRFPLPLNFVVDDTPRFSEAEMPYSVKFMPCNDRAKKIASEFAVNNVSVMYSPPRSAYILPPMDGRQGLTYADARKTSMLSKQQQQPLSGEVVKNERMTSVNWHQDVRHIEVLLQSKNIVYEAGDIAVIYPENVFDVEQFLKQYIPGTTEEADTLDGDTIVFASSKRDPNKWLFPPSTLRNVFLKYLDILGVPKRYAIEQLSHFATDPEQKEKLLEISSSAGVDLYHSYIRRERRSFLDVLNDFSSCRPSIQHLVNIIPLIQPREFSIASSPNMHPGQLHLCVGVVEYLSFYKRKRHGLCSTYLASLQPGEKYPRLRLWIKKGVLRLPKDNCPMILVGPGTGIAPMRSLIEEHIYRYGSDDGARKPEKDHCLFFGNRHFGKDYLYKDELIKYNERKDWMVCTAFSRDQASKLYVQHKIVEHQELVWKILQQPDSVVFVSGSSKNMPSDVQKSLTSIVRVLGNKSIDEAKDFIMQMQECGRYVIECWS